MTKVISTKSIPTIFSTNLINEVKINHDKKIESDSEFREVIKKGYLLNNINLSTIPDIIQDAINNAIIDAKNQTLGDSLIQTLKQSLENLDDGIYKKIYIDNTITYLEELLIQKAGPEIVAAIADAKIAVATADLATVSQVQYILSRLEDSESSITTINETLNTQDTAMALRFDEFNVSINDTFAGYSNAIELYVDENGQVQSQKIEQLTTNIGLSFQELNELIVSTKEDWSAKSLKLITSPSGAITGYSFQDGSGLKSTFEINADNFKISNSWNTYTPFSISGTSLYFNGKVTFSNITGGDDIVTKQNVQDAINYNVTTIDGGKITTNSISANKINTNGLIAENISTNELVGKTITGGIINGARINGAVIKASYLDLDGGLEVLTNYHITVAMYNANPSLYTDAVYLGGTNEYRIPSLSTIREATLSQSITTSTTIYGAMWSYNTANVGNDLKAVKIRPTFNNQVSFELFRSVSSDTWFSEGFTYGRKNHFKLSLGRTTLVECTLDLSYAGSYASGNDDLTIVTVSGQGFATIVSQSLSLGEAYNRSYSIDIGIGTLSLNIICSGHDSEYSRPNQVTIVGTLTTGSKLLPFDWTSGRLKFEQIVAPSKPWYGSTSEFTVFSLNQSLYINNMI